MNEVYLTAEEIYAIDNLTEDKLLDFIALFSPKKKELVSHLFSKNRSVQVLEVLANERDEHNIAFPLNIESFHPFGGHDIRQA